uniref:Uncharacterized protein n=1 Tax=Parastrongyloides trichosuri TaxID=131310 RepID=A0A0N4ZYW5_PARTI
MAEEDLYTTIPPCDPNNDPLFQPDTGCLALSGRTQEDDNTSHNGTNQNNVTQDSTNISETNTKSNVTDATTLSSTTTGAPEELTTQTEPTNTIPNNVELTISTSTPQTPWVPIEKTTLKPGLIKNNDSINPNINKPGKYNKEFNGKHQFMGQYINYIYILIGVTICVILLVFFITLYCIFFRMKDNKTNSKKHQFKSMPKSKKDKKKQDNKRINKKETKIEISNKVDPSFEVLQQLRNKTKTDGSYHQLLSYQSPYRSSTLSSHSFSSMDISTFSNREHGSEGDKQCEFPCCNKKPIPKYYYVFGEDGWQHDDKNLSLFSFQISSQDSSESSRKGR